MSSSKAREFVDFWIENSVHATELYGMPGSEQDAGRLAARCFEMAQSQGISEEAIKAEFGDLTAYIQSQVKVANLTEGERRKRER